MTVLKRKLRSVAGWREAAGQRLVQAVDEMENGLIDADLGGSLFKKRVARPGRGKSGGYRTVLSARIGARYVFLHGFAKTDKANITQNEKKALQFAGKVFLDISTADLTKALQAGVHWWRCIVSYKLIESLRGDLAALQKAGAIGKVTMRQFEAISRRRFETSARPTSSDCASD